MICSSRRPNIIVKSHRTEGAAVRDDQGNIDHNGSCNASTTTKIYHETEEAKVSKGDIQDIAKSLSAPETLETETNGDHSCRAHTPP